MVLHIYVFKAGVSTQTQPKFKIREKTVVDRQ